MRREVKETGAWRCPKMGVTFLVVWPNDLARLSAQSAVGAATLAETRSSWRILRYFKTLGA